MAEWVSLDGYVSDKNGQLDFFSSLVRPTNAEADQVKFLESVDTIIMGRRTYEQFVRIWPARPTDTEALADKINTARKIVFSNSLADAPWGKWPKAEIVTGDAIPAIQQLKSVPGKNIVLWASISLAQSLMKANLIDEYHLFLCPVLTSGGRSLFTEDIHPAALKLSAVRHYETGTVFLNYQPLNSSL